MRRSELAQELTETLHPLGDSYHDQFAVVPVSPMTFEPPALGTTRSIAEAYGALKEASVMVAAHTDKYLLSRLPVRLEAMASCEIEDVKCTPRELLLSEAISTRSMGNADLVKDYVHALDQSLPVAGLKGKDVFRGELVQLVHAILMQSDNQYKDTPGKYRSKVVWIGGGDIVQSTFNPPPPEHLAGCMRDHLAYLNDTAGSCADIDLITRLAVAHAHFEAVHPFRDGNGRVGRLLLQMMLAAEGYEPIALSAYLVETRKEYYDALQAAQKRLIYKPLVILLAKAITASVSDMKSRRAALAALKKDWIEETRFRAGSTGLALLDVISAHPILTARQVCNYLDVSFPAASNALQALVKKGIVMEETGNSRNRIYICPAALKIWDRPQTS